MPRSDRWKEPQRYSVTIANVEENPALLEALGLTQESVEENLTVESFIGTARELILRFVADNHYELEIVGFTLDAKTAELVVELGWQATDLDVRTVKQQIALAMALEVPVYPEDDVSARHLNEIYADMLENGVVFEEANEEHRYIWTGDKAISVDGNDLPLKISPTESVFPADILLLAQDLSSRHRQVSEAFRTLADLRLAISRLGDLLTKDRRDEHALQRCLTHFPILFGLDYRRVIPKYKLGRSFELDFALERSSGLVDLVEIEPSNLRLYTQTGNPTKELVHAEQQVLDWLDWLEANTRLARDDLPGVTRPIGQVIIGTRRTLSDTDALRLRRRNAMWNGSIILLTYDDLLDRARSTLSILTRNKVASKENHEG